MFTVEVLPFEEMATQPADSPSKYIRKIIQNFSRSTRKLNSQGSAVKIRIIYDLIKTWLQSYLDNTL